MQFTTIVALISGLGLVSAVPLAADSNLPPPDQVQIVDLQYGGNGCPSGTVTKAFSDSKDLVTLLFDQYSAESGPNVPASKSRAACQLNLKMHYPQGFQFGIFKADYRGFVNLASGTEGYCKATYYFSGDSKQLSRSLKFDGPIAKDYLKTDEIGVESVVWSPCGTEGLLNIKTSVEIRPLGTPKYGLITVDSADLKYTQIYHLQWRRCTK